MKLKKVLLTKTLFVPGFIRVERVLEDNNATKGIEMKTHALGAACSFKGEEFLIPWGMIECVMLSSEATEDEVA